MARTSFSSSGCWRRDRRPRASRGLVLSGILVFAQFVLFLLIGVMLFTYYQHVPLPRTLARSDELLPTFIVTALTHGAAGFIVAAIVAAALSPSINAMAATTVNDFYAKYYRPGADEQTLMRVSQAVDGDLGRRADRRRDRGAVDAALGARRRARRRCRMRQDRCSARFCIGTLVPAITEPQAFVGMLAGLVVMTFVWGWTAVAFTWYVFIGATTTVAVAGLAHAIAPARSAAR